MIPSIKSVKARKADLNSPVDLNGVYVQKRHLEQLARGIDGGKRVSVFGPPGSGKTSLIEQTLTHWKPVCDLLDIPWRPVHRVDVIEQEVEVPRDFFETKEIIDLNTMFRETRLVREIRQWIEGDQQTLLALVYLEVGTSPSVTAQGGYKFLWDNHLRLDGQRLDTSRIPAIADTNYPGDRNEFLQLQPLDDAVKDRINIKVGIRHNDDQLLTIYKQICRDGKFTMPAAELERFATVSFLIAEARREGRLRNLPTQNVRSFKEIFWYREQMPNHDVVDAVLATFGGGGDPQEAEEVAALVASVFGLSSSSFRGINLA